MSSACGNDTKASAVCGSDVRHSPGVSPQGLLDTSVKCVNPPTADAAAAVDK